jgi:hypothetical protein
MIDLRVVGLSFGFGVGVFGLGCGDDGASDGGGDTAAATSQGEQTGAADSSGGPAEITVSGDAFAFTLPGTPYGLIDAATITILEDPSLSVVTDADGHFEITGVAPGSEATFLLARDGFPPARTKTFTIPEAGELSQVTFQVPDDDLFDALAGVLMIDVDPAACQLVSTVTRVGKSLYDEGAHGEAGATVTLEPALAPEQGPVYFNETVIPDPTLTETSEDGGVLFYNVPPGVYTMSAHKDGVTFESTTMKCDAGVLVNASPPFGLQAL